MVSHFATDLDVGRGCITSMKGLTYRESRCSLAVHWRKILVGWLQLRHQHVIGNCLLLHKDRDKLATSHWSAMALRTHIALGRRRGTQDDKRPDFLFSHLKVLGKGKCGAAFHGPDKSRACIQIHSRTAQNHGFDRCKRTPEEPQKHQLQIESWHPLD